MTTSCARVCTIVILSHVDDRKRLLLLDPAISLGHHFNPSHCLHSREPIAFVIMSKSISPSEVSAHNSMDTGLYIIIDSNVYDMTAFVDEHPGGAKILKRVGGKDASKQFWKVSPFPGGRCGTTCRRCGTSELQFPLHKRGRRIGNECCKSAVVEDAKKLTWAGIVSQRGRLKEVRGAAEDRTCGGEGQTIDYGISVACGRQ